MTTKKLLLAAFLAAITLFVFADIESGAYIIPSIGYGYVSNGTGYNVTNNVSYTLGINSGYAFNKYFAVDGSVTFMPNNYQGQTYNYFLTDVAARGSVPIGNFVSAYIHLGPGMLFNTEGPTNNNQVGLFAGIGVLFQLSHHFGINVEDYGIYIPNNTNSDINVLALGMAYAF